MYMCDLFPITNVRLFLSLMYDFYSLQMYFFHHQCMTNTLFQMHTECSLLPFQETKIYYSLNEKRLVHIMMPIMAFWGFFVVFLVFLFVCFFYFKIILQKINTMYCKR